jgi:hypothetical protein
MRPPVSLRWLGKIVAVRHSQRARSSRHSAKKVWVAAIGATLNGSLTSTDRTLRCRELIGYAVSSTPAAAARWEREIWLRTVLSKSYPVPRLVRSGTFLTPCIRASRH